MRISDILHIGRGEKRRIKKTRGRQEDGRGSQAKEKR